MLADIGLCGCKVMLQSVFPCDNLRTLVAEFQSRSLRILLLCEHFEVLPMSLAGDFLRQ